jgi:hypothetical protein
MHEIQPRQPSRPLPREARSTHDKPYHWTPGVNPKACHAKFNSNEETLYHSQRSTAGKAIMNHNAFVLSLEASASCILASRTRSPSARKTVSKSLTDLPCLVESAAILVVYPHKRRLASAVEIHSDTTDTKANLLYAAHQRPEALADITQTIPSSSHGRLQHSTLSAPSMTLPYLFISKNTREHTRASCHWSRR